MVRPKSKIPDRWENYSPIGRPIPDTRFICCKCPLKEELCRKLPSKDMWFTPQYMFKEVAELNKQVGLVIDLTNTDRYYDRNSVTFSGAEYQKIFTPGHDVPPKEAINLFSNFISTYEKKYSNKDLMIVVHCTHGVNRTGFQICHYLIDKLGWSFDKAVTTFNLARGHSIERENYLEALKEAERNRSIKKSSRSSKKEKRRKRRVSTSSSTGSSDQGKHRRRLPFVGPSTKRNATTVSDQPSVSSVSTTVPFLPPPPPPTLLLPPPPPPPNDLAMFNEQMALMQQMMMGVVQMQAMFSQFQQNPPPPPPSDEPAEQQGSSTSVGETGDRNRTADIVETKDNAETTKEDSEGSSTDSDDDGDKSSRPGWELGGKVEKRTAGEKRRIRKRRTEDMHRKMQRGKFWEIREMQKEKYGF